LSAVSSVQVGLADQIVWVRVDGRGTFQNSTGLKEFATEMMRRGHREFIVDLKNCELMDSTFMGTLAGMAMRLGPEGKLHIVHPNPRCRQVLRNLGLDRIVSLEEDAPAPAPGDPLRNAEGNPPREAKRETIIEAHENLVAANPENAVRFKDVIDFLKHKAPSDEARP
jgi:anti-sigma B factor antagonist